MVSTRGPVPKRSSERRRRNAVPGETRVVFEETVKVPPAPKGLHPIARRLYNSLTESGQSEFFEPSDWEIARLAAEITSRMLGSDFDYVFRHWHNCEDKKCKCTMPVGDVNPKSIDAVWKLWQSLMVTETERRRARVEVERGVSEPEDGPTALDAYRKMVSQ